jgi:hypothetical protein
VLIEYRYGIVIALGNHPVKWLELQPWNNLLLMAIMVWMPTGFAMVVLSPAIKAHTGRDHRSRQHGRRIRVVAVPQDHRAGGPADDRGRGFSRCGRSAQPSGRHCPSARSMSPSPCVCDLDRCSPKAEQWLNPTIRTVGV